MISFFKYNWMVRDEWFDVCSKLSYEELVKERIGGVKSILHTLLHIVAVEESWVADIKGVQDRNIDFRDFSTLESIIKFSEECRRETERIVSAWNPEKDHEIIMCPTGSGQMEGFTYGEILRHLIAHEIHHIGQISVWAREIGIQPVTANLIRRGLFTEK